MKIERPFKVIAEISLLSYQSPNKFTLSLKMCIVYAVLVGIIACTYLLPLSVSATRPNSHRIGDFMHFSEDKNVITGYKGTEEDIVIPTRGKNLITVASLGSNKYVRNVTLHDLVWQVGDIAFGCCNNLQNVYVDSDNEYFSSIDGVLFDKSGKTLLFYPSGRKQKEYHIPEGTLKISLGAFFIKEGCLGRTRYLRKIYLPKSVEEFTTNYAYKQKDTIRAICVDSKNENYMSSNGMLVDKKTRELLVFPEAKSKFVILPDNIKSIGEHVFYEKRIRHVQLNDELAMIGKLSFFGCKLRKVVIPDNVSVIGHGAFGDNMINTVKFGNSVRIIDAQAFCGNRIWRLRMGPNVETIGGFAFSHSNIICLKLNDSLKRIEGGAFYENNIVKLKLNDSLEHIGNHAFYDNKIRGKLIFPDSLKYIGEYAFTSEKITKVVIPDGVFIEGSLFGSDEFKKAYEEHGAGTYVRTKEGLWIKR